MSKELIKLPRNVAEAIEYFRHNERLSQSEIVWQAYQIEQTTTKGEIMRDFAADNFNDFLQSLVNGYEVEETPEDKVREYYTLHKDDLSTPTEYYLNEAMCEAVIATLNFLNIKIEGVNA